MPAPYTIEQTAEVSGLSVKYIRRLKSALPRLFEKHSNRGKSNAILFDESIVEILKRTKDLRDRGRTLQQIRDELADVAQHNAEKKEKTKKTETGSDSKGDVVLEVGEGGKVVTKSLERENTLLRSQVDLLQMLLRKAEDRFDRLLPEGKIGETKKDSFKSQMILWLVEAVVVTAFAAGFIFMIWLFAQKAFEL